MSPETPARRGAQREWLGNACVLVSLVALCLALVPLHDEAWWPAAPSRVRWIAAGAALAVFAILCAWAALARRRRGIGPDAHDEDTVLIGWASQTGFGEQIALQSSDVLRDAGLSVHVRPLSHIDIARLQRHRRALFVVSTTGEGDAPDHAAAFVRDVMGQASALPDLRYAVLALGDRAYGHFCGFGHRLDQWLQASAARSLFDLVEVDNGDGGALRHWQHHLGVLADAHDMPDWAPAAYQQWTLRTRTLANPGSAGNAAFHLVLTPPAGTAPSWQAGDIAEIGPRNAPAAVDALLERLGLRGDEPVIESGDRVALADLLSRSQLPDPAAAAGRDAQAIADALQPLPHREYSIASLPDDGAIDLLVREMPRSDGTPGLGSSWLCRHAPCGDAIALRIRSNRNFHPPEQDRPLILIGNGTGLAGLRAHVKARVLAGARRNWLLFGERNAAHDVFFRTDLVAWRLAGWLERTDFAFSRDDTRRQYVQDVLRDAADPLCAWVADGACILVCGSAEGMAPGVDAVLRDTLGSARVDALREAGLYRRDVY